MSSKSQHDELRQALALPHVLPIGDAPQWAVVALDENADPDAWMLVIQPRHPRRRFVRVLDAELGGHRIEHAYPRDFPVFLVASPAQVTMALLYDRPLRAAYRTHRDRLTLMRWKINSAMRVYTVGAADADPDSAGSTSTHESEQS